MLMKIFSMLNSIKDKKKSFHENTQVDDDDWISASTNVNFNQKSLLLFSSKQFRAVFFR